MAEQVVQPEWRPKRPGGWLRKLAKTEQELRYWREEARFWHAKALQYHKQLKELGLVR